MHSTVGIERDDFPLPHESRSLSSAVPSDNVLPSIFIRPVAASVRDLFLDPVRSRHCWNLGTFCVRSCCWGSLACRGFSALVLRRTYLQGLLVCPSMDQRPSSGRPQPGAAFETSSSWAFAATLSVPQRFFISYRATSITPFFALILVCFQY